MRTAVPQIIVPRGLDRGLLGTVAVSALVHAAGVALLVLMPGRLLTPVPRLESYTVDLIAPNVVGGTNLVAGGGLRKPEPAAAKAVGGAAIPPAPQGASPANSAASAAKPAPVNVEPPKPQPKPAVPPKPEPVQVKPEPVKAKPVPSKQAAAAAKPKPKPAPPPKAPPAAAKPAAGAKPPPKPEPKPVAPKPAAKPVPAQAKAPAKPAKPDTPQAKAAAKPAPAKVAKAAPTPAAPPAPKVDARGATKPDPRRAEGAQRDQAIAAAIERRKAEAAKQVDQQIAAAVGKRAAQVAATGGGSGQPGTGGPISSGPGQGAGGTPTDLQYVLYHGRMIERIKSAWAWAGADRSLRVVIAFGVAADGQIRNVRVVQPSGDGSYDASAERAVRAVSPLDPVPDKYRDHFATVELTFQASDLES